MKELVKKNSALLTFLKVLAARNTQWLIDSGFYDPVVEGPDLQKVGIALQAIPITAGYTEIPESELEHKIYFWPSRVAVAFQALGNSDIAARWYALGQDSGRFAVELHPVLHVNPAWYSHPPYEHAAICSLLSGNAPHARFLFQRILDENPVGEAEILSLQKIKQHRVLATCLSFKIFALMCLGDQWDEVARLSFIALRMIAKRKKAAGEVLFGITNRLIEIGSYLSGYFLNPCTDTREMAISSLLLDSFPSNDPGDRCTLLGYLFALIHLYPELSPYSSELWQHPLWRPSMSQRETPPTKAEIQTALYDIFRQTLKKKKGDVLVNSIELHLKVGGYPSPDHQIRLCNEVMRENKPPDPREVGGRPDPKNSEMNVRYLASDFEIWPVSL